VYFIRRRKHVIVKVSVSEHIDLRVGFSECSEKGYPPSPHTHTHTISVVVASMIVVMKG